MNRPESGSVEVNEFQSLKQEMPKSWNAFIGKIINRA